MAGALDLAQERTRDEEGRRQVLAQRLVPALERQLPDGHVLARPDAVNRGADVDRAERVARLVEQAVDVVLDGEIRLRDGRAAELLCQRARPLLATVEVDEHARAFRGERASARRADPARRAGDHYALALKPRLDPA